MIARRPALALLASGLIAGLLLCLPLRWLMPEGALSARAVTGSIWSGSIAGAQWSGMSLGDLDAGLRWPGVLRVTSADPGADPLRADVRPGAGMQLSALQGSVALGRSFGPITLERISFRNARLNQSAAGCAEAAGRITLSARLTDMAGGPPVTLGGPLRCEGPNLVASLKSQSGMEMLEAIFFPNQGWSVKLTLRPGSPDLATALRAHGFVETPLGYVRQMQGEAGR
jgi:general secretion pathway protein N